VNIPHRTVGDNIVAIFKTSDALVEGMKRLSQSTDNRASLVISGITRSI
jgi:hypothetical protein